MSNSCEVLGNMLLIVNFGIFIARTALYPIDCRPLLSTHSFPDKVTEMNFFFCFRAMTNFYINKTANWREAFLQFVIFQN